MQRLILSIPCFLITILLYAQSLFGPVASNNDSIQKPVPFAMNGSLRTSIYAPGEIFDYNSILLDFALITRVQKNDFSLYAESRLRKGWLFQGPIEQFQLREAYAAYKQENISLKLGNQIIKWGSADGFNPTNNISPKDYFWNTTEPDEQNIANFMLSGKYKISRHMQFEFIGIPFYKASSYRYDLIKKEENIRFNPVNYTELKIKDGALAARLLYNTNSFSCTASIFNGLDPFTAFDIQQIIWTEQNPSIAFEIRPYRKTSIGFDFETIIEGFILRGETAYNYTSDFENNIHVPNPDLAYVMNLENSFYDWHMILQYIGKYTLNYYNPIEPELPSNPTDPILMQNYFNQMIAFDSGLFNAQIFGQQKRISHAVSLTLLRSFNYETMEFQMNAYYNFITEEYLLKPKFTWMPSDLMTIHLGLNYMYGKERALFAYIAPYMNGFFIEINTHF